MCKWVARVSFYTIARSQVAKINPSIKQANKYIYIKNKSKKSPCKSNCMCEVCVHTCLWELYGFKYNRRACSFKDSSLWDERGSVFFLFVCLKNDFLPLVSWIKTYLSTESTLLLGDENDAQERQWIIVAKQYWWVIARLSWPLTWKTRPAVKGPQEPLL